MFNITHQNNKTSPHTHQDSESESHSVVSNSLWPHGLYPWNSPGQYTGVGSLSLLQGLFPIQGLNPGLPHCRQVLYQLSHKGSPRVLKWVADPFSSGSSRPRNQTRVSFIAGRFFTKWAMREAHSSGWLLSKKRKRERKKITNVGKHVEKLGPLCSVGETIKWYNYYGKQ